MNIGEYFSKYGGESVIFDPIPSYDGDWLFSLDNLVKNSKKDGQINLFLEFFKKTYAEPLESIFKTPRILDFKVAMVSRAKPDKVGRCLRYSKVDFFVEITTFLREHIDIDGMSNEEVNAYLNGLFSHIKDDNDTLNNAYHEALKEKARKLRDVLENEINSPYYDAALKDYEHYKDKISFNEYINSSLKITMCLQTGMLRLGDFFDRDIDFKSLADCFTPDTFYLLFAKNIYEFNLRREKESGHLDNSYGYLISYKNAVSEIVKSDKKYNPKILYVYPSGKKEQYSRWQFQIEAQELLDRHPEARAFKLPEVSVEEQDKFKDINLMQKIVSLYAEETSVNWEFLPEGEGIKRGEYIIPKDNHGSKQIDRDTLVEEVNMRIQILENSGFIGRPIKGLNTFSGYFAFIYPNGKVILEKFWENEEALRPAERCATYVMDIDNFIELSKMTRINLVEYIKTFPEVGVKRIFHTSINNWQRNLYNEINGTYRLEDAIEFINGLRNGEAKNEI